MDIVLAILLFVITSVTAYVGIHVTLHPAETPRAKTAYKLLFAILTLLAAGLIGWQTFLNRGEQARLHAQLNQIQQNTEQPPKPPVVNVSPPIVQVPRSGPAGAGVTVENRLESSYFESDANGKPTGKRIPFVPGKNVAFNFYTINNGPEIAEEAEQDSRIYIESGTMEHEDDAAKKAAKRFTQRLNTIKRSHTPIQVGSAGEFWATAQSDEAITDADVKSLTDGGKLMFLLSYTAWRDSTGRHYLKRCESVQPPAFQPEVWHVCSVYNEHH